MARALLFCHFDVFCWYDPDPDGSTENANVITQQDLNAINNFMRARSNRAAWAPLLDKEHECIHALPREVDLVEMSDTEWAATSQLVERAFKDLSRRRIGSMAVSKVLYRKRPRLIAICDSYVKKRLGVPPGRPECEAIMVMNRVRDEGRRNMALLRNLRGELARVELHLGERTRKIAMTNVRLMDILLWSWDRPAYSEFIRNFPHFVAAMSARQ